MELPKTLYSLTGALLARGYTNGDLAKIWDGNWLRVMDRVWGDPKAELIESNGAHDLKLHPHDH
jgi:hypothetical protein